jgi:hypothetical protein
MSKLLEQAIAKARTLPEEEQDALGAVLLSMTDDEGGGIMQLDDDTRSAIREGLEQARRGEFVPDEEIEALWKRYGYIESALEPLAPSLPPRAKRAAGRVASEASRVGACACDWFRQTSNKKTPHP